MTASSKPATLSVRNHDDAFRAAIDRGVLSADFTRYNWAGHYMYMFHDEDGTAYFKHCDTRTYLSMPPATCPPAP